MWHFPVCIEFATPGDDHWNSVTLSVPGDKNGTFIGCHALASFYHASHANRFSLQFMKIVGLHSGCIK